jgi:hypothetical protein
MNVQQVLIDRWLMNVQQVLIDRWLMNVQQVLIDRWLMNVKHLYLTSSEVFDHTVENFDLTTRKIKYIQAMYIVGKYQILEAGRKASLYFIPEYA